MAELEVQLTVGGQEFRLDTRHNPRIISKVDISWELEIGEPTAKPREIKAMVVLGEDFLGVSRSAQLISGGRATVTLHLKDGTALEWIKYGVVKFGTVFGEPGEPLEITISDPVYSLDARVPPRVVDATSFPTIADSFPVDLNQDPVDPYGSVGMPVAEVFGTVTGMKLPQVTEDGDALGTTWVVGSSPDLDVTHLYSEDGTALDIADYTVTPSVDENGYSYTRIRHLAGPIPTTLYATVTHNEPQHALSVARELLIRYGAPVDEALIARAMARSPNIVLNGALNGEGAGGTGTLGQVVSEVILAQLPMFSGLWGPEGFGFAYVDRSSPVVGEMRVGDGTLIERTSDLSESTPDEVFNSFEVQFDMNYRRGTHAGWLGLNPRNDSICEASALAMYTATGFNGERFHDVIEASWVKDAGSAGLIAVWYRDHKVFGSYPVEFCVDETALKHYTPGDTIRITDPKTGFDNDKFVITAFDLTGLTKCLMSGRVYPQSIANYQ